MGQIEIIPAPLAFKSEMKDLARHTFDAHRARQPFAFPENLFELMDHVGGAFENGRTPYDPSPCAYCATMDGAFAGYVILSGIEDAKDMLLPTVNIEDISVLPQFQRQGVAVALIRTVLQRAEQEKWGNVKATVWHGNSGSEALFRDLGFADQCKTLRFGPTTQIPDIKVHSAPSGSKRSIDWMFWIVLIALAIYIAYIGAQLSTP